MRIGLLNFHYAYNYGAVLQSTALMKQLQKMGHNVELINYRPFYQMQYYLPYPNPFKAFKCAWKKKEHDGLNNRIIFSVKWFVRTILNYRHARYRKELKELFTTYVRKTFREVGYYDSLDGLMKNPPDSFDAYICGSDQLWNPDVTWGVDPAYYLNFGNVKRRIAYAVSPCGLDCRKYSQNIRAAGAKLDFISLRENEKLSDLSQVFNRKDIIVCPDPTLLLSEIDYEEFEEPIQFQSDSYLLFYGFLDKEKNVLIQKIIKRAGKLFKLPIIDMSIDDFGWDDSSITRIHVTPGQFLSYIKHARYVITNSFHGTVFSIIYKKQFTTICKTGTASRMEELLNKLNLHERICNGDEVNLKDIDYASVAEKLSTIQGVGEKYLETTLS